MATSTDWRPLPSDLDRPPEELDLTDPPVSERRRAAVLVSSVLAVPVMALLAVLVTAPDPAPEPAPRASAVAAPTPVVTVAPVPSTLPLAAAVGPVDATGIPGRVLEAYRGAERVLGESAPGCHLPWSLVAAIGRVESDHAGGGAVTVDGRTLSPIRGPRLDGTAGHPFFPDTDAGSLDGDPGVDLAVGPMQFLPSSWATYGAGDADDVDDAAVASGRHLCAGGADLADPAQRAAAVFDYNHSDAYVAQVLALEVAYAAGTSAPVTLPSVPVDVPPGVPLDVVPNVPALAPDLPAALRPADPVPPVMTPRPSAETTPVPLPTGTTEPPATTPTEPTPPTDPCGRRPRPLRRRPRPRRHRCSRRPEVQDRGGLSDVERQHGPQADTGQGMNVVGIAGSPRESLSPSHGTATRPRRRCSRDSSSVGWSPDRLALDQQRDGDDAVVLADLDVGVEAVHDLLDGRAGRLVPAQRRLRPAARLLRRRCAWRRAGPRPRRACRPCPRSGAPEPVTTEVPTP